MKQTSHESTNARSEADVAQPAENNHALPAAFRKKAHSSPLDLRRFIAIYDGALPSDLCTGMIRNFQSNVAHQIRNGAGIRPALHDSAWTEMNVMQMATSEFRSIFEMQARHYRALYNEHLSLSRPISPIQRISDLMMKWYRCDQQDRFQIHYDSIYAVSNRYLVYLWYLNDVAVGGETWFPDLDVKIAPRTGRLVIFPPYWMFQHAGLPPKSGDKYILSGYALY